MTQLKLFLRNRWDEILTDELMDLLGCNDENSIKTQEIAADITGGTTTMSVGVFSMTEERNVCVNGTQEAVFVSR
jgi:hypothetical protein